MRVAEIDVHDDEQVRAFWAAGKEGDEFDRPYAAYRSLEAVIIGLREKSPSSDLVSLAAWQGGEQRTSEKRHHC